MGTIYLIIATFLQLAVIELLDNKIEVQRTEFYEKLKSYDRIDFMFSYNDISKILMNIEILESIIFVGLFPDKEDNFESYTDNINIIETFGHYNYLLRQLDRNYRLIKIPELRTTQDSILKQSRIIYESDISIVKKDSSITDLVNLSNDLYKKHVALQFDKLDEIRNKIFDLRKYRNGAYGGFVVLQVLALLLIGYSQIIKDNISKS